MDCTRHLLNFEWERHHWRKHVTLAERLPKHDTNMWGRTVNGHYVRCMKHDVCDVCGETRRETSCVCDCEVGNRCPIRLEWLNASHHPAV